LSFKQLRLWGVYNSNNKSNNNINNRNNNSTVDSLNKNSSGPSEPLAAFLRGYENISV